MAGSRASAASRPQSRGDRQVRAVPPARDVLQGGHVAEMQRRRLLTATFELAFEGGVQAMSVAVLCERAGLSRRTFYDIFDDREECVHAAFEEALHTAVGVASQAAAGHERWRERVRAGLTALLDLFDCQPGMGRLLVVDALSCGPPTLEARKRALAQVAAVIDEGRHETSADRSRSARTRGSEVQTGEPPPLTAEGIVGAVLSLVHAHMLERDPRPLTDLTGSLMALIVHPYLGGTASQCELETSAPAKTPLTRRLPADPFKDLPIRLTYRTACVLTSIAHSPGASSKQVADASGITDAGQISRLLTRLRRNGLIQDTGVGPTKGMARAWSLTERGQDILQATGQV